MAVPLPMTAGRWVALAIGAPLALATIGFTGLSLVAQAGQGSYRVDLNLPAQGRTVSVALDSGDVTVGPTAGSRVLVRGVAHYSLIRSQVTWRRTSASGQAGLSVSSRCHQITGDCSFNLTVGLPATPAAVISDGSGDLTAHDVPGRLTLRSQSGDVHLADLPGTVTITGQSGDITGSRLSGAQLSIHDNSGDITVNGLASSDVTAVDQSGNVVLSFSKVPAHVVVHDNSGDVTVVLPSGPTAYQVQASTNSGTTSIGVPRSPSSPHVITVTNQSGNVVVTR